MSTTESESIISKFPATILLCKYLFKHILVQKERYSSSRIGKPKKNMIFDEITSLFQITIMYHEAADALDSLILNWILNFEFLFNF